MSLASKTSNETLIDARGPRFGAAITTAVVATALATNSAWPLLIQLLVFIVGAFKGPQFTPYAFVFRNLVKPRLKSNPKFEDVRPPKFAQQVGLGFVIVALIGHFTFHPLFVIAGSACLTAAFLNAAFDFCLGCQIYLRVLRFKSGR